MLLSTALRQSSSAKFLKSPGGGPPALLIRMSGLGQAASSALRPSSVVTSHATGVTFTPREASSLAVALSASAPRAQIVTSTPSRASASAQPLPSPFEAAHTMADLPLMPRSIEMSPCLPRRRQDASGRWRKASRRGAYPVNRSEALGVHERQAAPASVPTAAVWPAGGDKSNPAR